jgi:tricorn protease-like protein
VSEDKKVVFQDDHVRLVVIRVSAGNVYILEVSKTDAMGGLMWVERWRGGVW